MGQAFMEQTHAYHERFSNLEQNSIASILWELPEENAIICQLFIFHAGLPLHKNRYIKTNHTKTQIKSAAITL